MSARLFSAEEINSGIAVLGKRDDAVFLRERLMRELVAVYGGSMNPGALSHHEGRRSLAADILKLLDLELDNDRPDASRLFSASAARHGGPGSGLARRVPDDPPDGYGRGPRPTRTRSSRNKSSEPA